MVIIENISKNKLLYKNYIKNINLLESQTFNWYNIPCKL